MSAILAEKVRYGNASPEADRARVLLIEDIRDVAAQLVENGVIPLDPNHRGAFNIADRKQWPIMVFDIDKVRILYWPKCHLVQFPPHWDRWQVRYSSGVWHSRDLCELVIPRLRHIIQAGSVI